MIDLIYYLSVLKASSDYLVVSRGFCFVLFCHLFQIFYISEHVICEQSHFYFFLPDMYFFLPTVLSRNFSALFKRSSVKRHSFLVFNLSMKTSSFSTLSLMLFVGVFLVDVLYQPEEVPSILSLLRIFIVNGCQIS